MWSGAGMGEKLGVVEALARDGITPISLDSGLAVLRRVLADPSAGPVLVVSGRTAGLPTIHLDRAELPPARFVDRVLVHYPRVELVAEAELSAANDPYLADHRLDGDQLFPAVLGMEAMAQAAVAVSGADTTPLLTEVEFLCPIVVPPGGTTTVRLVALARNSDTVTVAIRSAATRFATDHFRARLRFPRPEPSGERAAVPAGLPEVPVDPVSELYGGLLFQGKRFQRLLSYRKVAARHAVAELSTTALASWFGTFLPQERVLADPGTRDAVMHAISCCVPDATLLPQGIERLYPADPAARPPGVVVMDARERMRDGDTYIYDVDVLTDRRAQTELAATRALGRRAGVRYRPDGRPEIEGGAVSASRGAGLTLVVTGEGRLACDVEVVAARTEDDWATLIGPRHLPLCDLVVAEAGEPVPLAATRVWSVLECLRKAGMTAQALTLDRVAPDGSVVFSDGESRVATWVTTVNDVPDQWSSPSCREGRTDMAGCYQSRVNTGEPR